jgi:hypothetical protein
MDDYDFLAGLSTYTDQNRSRGPLVCRPRLGDPSARRCRGKFRLQDLYCSLQSLALYVGQVGARRQPESFLDDHSKEVIALLSGQTAALPHLPPTPAFCILGLSASESKLIRGL